jgi:SAM-dependent methyltransferase
LSAESFRPVRNSPPTTVFGKIKFYGRMLLDLQVLTVYRDLRQDLPTFKGRVLDVGCGESPYRFLLGRDVQYVGTDILDPQHFDRKNAAIVAFNGQNLPFAEHAFDAVVCTEVLEHVKDYQSLIDEIHRVMRVGGRAIFTVPWSARNHYIPHDFYRYTPTSLATMFAGFQDSSISQRGTDISTIGSKVVVLWFRNLFPSERSKLALVPLWILASPLLIISLVIAHICTLTRTGSLDDPLGYTIRVTK